MTFTTLNVTEILKIDNVELYQTKNEYSSLIDKGSLSVLYSQDYQWFILQINEFKYGLSKNIPVLASHGEKDAIGTYVFTSMEGYYVIRVTQVSRSEDLDTFEEILKQNTQFAYKEGLNDEGLPVEVQKGDVKIKRSVSEGQRQQEPQGFNTAHLIYSGGKATKSIMISSAQAISGGITQLGGFIQNNYLGRQEEMEINPKTMNRMEMVKSATGILSSAGSLFIRGLTAIGSFLANRIEPKFEQKKEEAELKEQAQASKPSGTVGEAAIHSAVSLWTGMVEALDIIREGITETTTSMVTHKYGSSAGEVFRSGVGIATNIGLPGNKLFKKN